MIVPMNVENRNCFIKDSSAYVSNINRVLRNIKSEIVANFVRLDSKGIIITTHKISSTLDL